MTHSVQRWGNSLAVRLPRDLTRAAGLAAGSPVDLRFDDGLIVVVPLSGPRRLEELLAGVLARDLHDDLVWAPEDPEGYGR